jgi:hypothetical protein
MPDLRLPSSSRGGCRGDLDEPSIDRSSPIFSVITVTVTLAAMSFHALPVFRILLNEDINPLSQELTDQSLEICLFRGEARTKLA